MKRECEKLKDRLRELDLGNGSEIVKLRELTGKHKFELTVYILIKCISVFLNIILSLKKKM